MEKTKNKKYRLFLDDFRKPYQVADYIEPKLKDSYRLHEWVIVKNFREFIECVMDKGLPTHISFDHDLHPEHYNKSEEFWIDYYSKGIFLLQNKTGYDCASWVICYILENNLTFPEFFIHSMNPIGEEYLQALFNQYKVWRYERHSN